MKDESIKAERNLIIKELEVRLLKKWKLDKAATPIAEDKKFSLAKPGKATKK